MPCDRSPQLSAYHDGELPRDAAQALESHLQSCDACRAELAALNTLTARLRTAHLQQPTSAAIERWASACSAAQDRGVRRLAGWLSAAALIVLMVSLPGALRATSPMLAPLSEAEAIATLPDADSEPATLVAARWMAIDLSLSREGSVTR